MAKPYGIDLAFIVSCAVGSIVLRLAAFPWDFGGFFYQLWTTGIAVVYVTAGLPMIEPPLRMVNRVFLYPVVPWLLFGSVYFAPQALFPFMFMAFAVGGAVFLWSRQRTRLAVLVALLLLPLGAYGLYGIGHIAVVTRLRNLEPEDVLRISFIPRSGKEEVREVTDSSRVSAIVTALRSTSPYSPNHEGIREPWEFRVALQRNDPITCRIGNGNRTHGETVWIQFGVEVYQNPVFYGVLKELQILPWGGP